MFLNVNRSEFIVAHQAFADEDGVLIVTALPRHKRNQHIVPQSQLATVRGRTVGQHVFLFHPLPLGDNGALVDTRALIGTLVFAQRILSPAAIAFHHDLSAGDAGDHSILGCHYDLTRVHRRLPLHTGCHQRHFRLE